MKNQLRGILTAGAAVFLVMSCKNSNDPEPSPKGAYTEGVIVINGGNFSQNNGTFSFLQREGKTVVENIYNLVNGQVSLPPEDGRIEGYGEAGETGMILFDHSSASGMDKVVFVNASTFEKKSELKAPAIENPRDVAVINAKKAYVTNWDALNADYSYKDGFITVVDPESGTSTRKISVGKAPENMVLHQKKVYVGRASWTINQLAIVNTDTDEIVKSLDFDSSPSPIGIDAGGKLWVKEGHRLHRINTSTDVVEATLEAGSDAAKSIGAAALTADGQNIIFVLSKYEGGKEVGGTYVFNTSSPSIQVNTPVLNRVFSALGADPVSKSIYGGVSPSFTQAGYVLRVSPLGALQDSVKVEISPEGFFFK